MNSIKKAKLYTVVTHSLIFIAVFHGVGILLMFDIRSVFSLFYGDLVINIMGNFQERLPLIGVVSVVGKALLIYSLFVKNEFYKNLLAFTALIILWFSVFLMTLDWDVSSLGTLAFMTSVPFFISSIILAYLILKNKGKESCL